MTMERAICTKAGLSGLFIECNYLSGSSIRTVCAAVWSIVFNFFPYLARLIHTVSAQRGNCFCMSGLLASIPIVCKVYCLTIVDLIVSLFFYSNLNLTYNVAFTVCLDVTQQVSELKAT